MPMLPTRASETPASRVKGAAGSAAMTRPRSAHPLAEQGPGGVDARLGHVVHPGADEHLAAEPLRGDHPPVTPPVPLRHVLALLRRHHGLVAIDQALIPGPCRSRR